MSNSISDALKELIFNSSFDLDLFCSLAEIISQQININTQRTEGLSEMNNTRFNTIERKTPSLKIEEIVEVDITPSNDWRQSCFTIKEKLFQSLQYGYFADVKFVVGHHQRKEIPAHKLILNLTSTVFESIFESSPANKVVNVTVADVEPDAFASFLRFIYTDEFEVHVKDATAVLYLAKKYNIGKLVVQCGDFIKSNISCKNVVSVLLSAEALGEKSISTQARQFLRRNISYVIHEDDFLQLNSEELSQILASDELVVHELELFNAAIRWATEECKRQKLEQNSQNYRYALKNVLPLIRFPLMTRKQFTFHVATRNILTDTECLNILMHFDVSSKERATLPPLLFNSKPRMEARTDGRVEQAVHKDREFYESFYYDPKNYQVSNAPAPPRRSFATTPSNINPMRVNASNHQVIAQVSQQSWNQPVGLPTVGSYGYGNFDYSRY